MTSYRNLSTAGDRRFVLSCWSASYKNAQAAGLIDAEDWSTIMHAQLGKLIDRPGTRTIIAFDPPDHLYGFICGDTSHPMPVVHYVYVKDPYRSEEEPGGGRTGPRIARGLFAALGVDPGAPLLYTCRTSISVRLADKIPYARFAPAAARYANYHEHQERRSRQ